MKSLHLKKSVAKSKGGINNNNNNSKPIYKDISRLENLKTAPDFTNELINNNVHENSF
jgi:hypothetical protein